jgi:gliding motility-associated-like protein
LTSTTNGTCNPVSDTIIIHLVVPPLVEAGDDQTICTNTHAILSGSVSGTSTIGVWTSTGTGTFLPNSTSLNATYIPTAQDALAGTITLTLSSASSCLVQDNLTLTVIAAPTVNAGSDTVICADVTQITLNGNVSGITTTGEWTSLGTGTFIPDNSTLDAVYQISHDDSIAGHVQLILTSTSNGSCNAVSDTLLLTITSVPSVDAGSDQIVCANNVVMLDGQVTGGVGAATWTTSGSGTFVPDANTLNATYVLSESDTSNENITLTLTSTGACVVVYDEMVVIISPAPHVNAGNDITVCANNPDVTLSGSIWGGSTTGTWTTSGDGSFFPSPDDLNATYIPGSQDISVGSDTLVLAATNIGTCLPVTDTLIVVITAPPLVDAGNTIYICNDDNAHLNGSITSGSGTGIWQTDGDGTFTPNDFTLTATYIPGNNDITNEIVALTLTSTNNGGCLPVSDVLTLHITSHPTVNAGTDTSICENATVQLNGTVSGSSTTGYWSTNGDGTFNPDSSALNAIYTPGSIDTLNGSVELILTSTLACPVKDTLVITLIPAPIANAGNNQVICQGVMTVNLNGNVANASGGYYWQTNGTGTFIPDSTSLTTSYQLSSQDSTNGSVILTLVAVGNGLCNNDVDSLTVVTAEHIQVDAGEDITVCASGEVFLNGNANAGTLYWTTLGTGTFAPDSSDMMAQYLFSEEDTAIGSVEIVLNSQTSCGLYTDTMQITFTPVTYVDAGIEMTACKNAASVQLNGIISGGSITGQWTTSGTGYFLPSDSALDATYFFSSYDTSQATMVFWLTSTNNGTCLSVTDSVYIDFEAIPVVFAGNNVIICAGSNVSLNGQIESASGTGYWTSNGDGSFNPSSTSLQTTYIPGTNDLITGTVLITLNSDATSACGSVSDSLTATIITSESAAHINSSESLCFGDSLYIIPVIAGDTGVFAWTTNGSGIFLPDTFNVMPIYLPSSSDLGAGNILIFMHYSCQCGAVDDTLSLTINPIPVARYTNINHCNNFDVNFIDSSLVSNGSINNWDWEFGDGSSSSINNPIHTYLSQGDYDVTLVVTSEAGCLDTIVKQIHVYEMVVAAFAASDTMPSIGSQVNFTNNSTGAISYYWTFGDNTGTSDLINPNYTYSAPGEYPVWLYAYSQNSCIDSTTVNIHINFAGYAIPSAFSPNNDGLNDVLFVRGGPFVEYEMRIFNSWGQQIFISNSQTIGWDGTYKGKDAQEGVYVLIFKGKIADGTEINYSGDITLVR